MILLAGPCVIESRDNIMRIAEELNTFHADKNIDFFFKASFDKANRTSLESFRGPGLDEGLKVLQEVKDQFGYKIITDFHTPDQAAPAAEVVDILQVPAFLCRQTDMIVEAAKTDAIVNIKKGQFVNPQDMQYSVNKALKTRGCDEVSYENAKKHNVWLTERGSSFGYGNMVVDMRALPIMRGFAPVLFDATHSVQMPGSGKGSTGGDSTMIPYLSRAAAATGVDGFFFETHFDPSVALSDGPNMMQLDKLKALLPVLEQISQFSVERK